MFPSHDQREGNFLELQKITSQAIITAYGWTPSLTGIAIAGKLGSNQTMKQDLEYVTNMEIKGVQRLFEQKIINPFIKENQEVNNKLKGVMLQLANSNPISLAGDLVPKEVLTKNEMREILGYEALEEGEQIDSENQMTDNEPQLQSE